MATKELAEKIANDLFTNGFGEKADRLVMLSGVGDGGKSGPPPRRNLGGWCYEAVVNRIKQGLESNPHLQEQRA